jgi:pyruvate dehydrogenase E2 component (dihydrolipoamide acetyltransferase)
MADLKEARVPDIGQSDVPVIEVLVKAGDRVEKEQSLITLESDKATMEVPAPFAGTVKEVKVKVGDEVAEGTLIATIEADDATSEAAPAAKVEAPKTEPKKVEDKQNRGNQARQQARRRKAGADRRPCRAAGQCARRRRRTFGAPAA